MESKYAKEAFLDYVKSTNTRLDTPALGLPAMCGFYRNVRATDIFEIENDGDMLLFEYGIYDWGDATGRHFNLGCARQLMPLNGGGDDVWQLRVSYAFTPSPDLALLGEGAEWCPSPDGLVGYERYIAAHPAFLAVADRADGVFTISYSAT